MTLLAHTRFGGGPRNALLMHGFLGSGRNLQSLARRWTEADPSRSAWLIDLTGHGSSPPLRPGADLGSVARDVLDTADAVGLERRFDLVGHSLGGRVGLAALIEAPDRVGDVVLLDISPSPLPPGTGESNAVLEVLLRQPERVATRDEAKRNLLDAGLSPALADWLLMNLRPEAGAYSWRIDWAALAEAAPRVNAVDLWPALHLPGHRVLCVRGGASPYLPDADARRVEARRGRVVTLPGAGHFVHVDALEGVVKALIRWG